MIDFVANAALPGLPAAAVSDIARGRPGWGGPGAWLRLFRVIPMPVKARLDIRL